MSATEIAERIATEIESEDNEVVANAILRGAYVFERFRYKPDEGFGWDDDIFNTDDFSVENCLLIRRALIRLIRSTPCACGEHVGAACWALGKLRDKNLIPFLTAVLAKQAHWVAGCMSQAIFALDGMGEDLWRSYDPKKTSYGFDDPETFQIAIKYIESHGYPQWAGGAGRDPLPVPPNHIDTRRFSDEDRQEDQEEA